MSAVTPERTPIKLLLSDVDGTLVNARKELTPRTIAAVQALYRHNIRFAVTSGRPPRGMAMLIEPLALTAPLAAFNGGVLVRPDLSLIDSHCLPQSVAQTAFAQLLAVGLDAWLFTGSEWFVRDRSAPRVEHEAATIRVAPMVTPELPARVFAEAVKIVGVSDDYALVERAERELGRQFAQQASVSRSQPYYLDITHPQANKGAVVTTLAALLDIPRAQIATIGDMPNDVLMFEQSGFSIAMGNASAAVQQRADAITASCEEEGFAKAVETWILGRG